MLWMNDEVQEFIADLNRTELAPKSIRNIIGVLKLILGKRRWQDWNLVLPEIPEQEQRYFTEDEMRQIVNSVTGQWRPICDDGRNRSPLWRSVRATR